MFLIPHPHTLNLAQLHGTKSSRRLEQVPSFPTHQICVGHLSNSRYRVFVGACVRIQYLFCYHWDVRTWNLYVLKTLTGSQSKQVEWRLAFNKPFQFRTPKDLPLLCRQCLKAQLVYEVEDLPGISVERISDVGFCFFSQWGWRGWLNARGQAS